MIKQQLTDDVKIAMLAGDKLRLETLRGLKSVILYAEVAAGKRDVGLMDEEILALLAKEAKKRQESADLYEKGGSPDRAQKEITEKKIIEGYLPAQMTEAELAGIIDKHIAEQKVSGVQAMGQIIGAVKKQVGSAGNGAVIARLVKEKLS